MIFLYEVTAMNPQTHLNELFLGDVIEQMKNADCDAVSCFTRLRLYIAVTGYRKTLRELLKEQGVSSRDYDRLLCAYNRQLTGRL